jgi:hypothetical protein
VVDREDRPPLPPVALMERGWRSGPRLPSAHPSKRLECFRCSEDRRILRLYTVRWNEIEVGGMLLCDLCSTALMPLNPDPLDVTSAA